MPRRLWNVGPDTLEMQYGGRWMSLGPNEVKDIPDEPALHFLQSKDEKWPKRGLVEIKTDQAHDKKGLQELRIGGLIRRRDNLRFLLHENEIYRAEVKADNGVDPGVTQREIGIAEEYKHLCDFLGKQETDAGKVSIDYYRELTEGQFEPPSLEKKTGLDAVGIASTQDLVEEVSVGKRQRERKVEKEDRARAQEDAAHDKEKKD